MLDIFMYIIYILCATVRLVICLDKDNIAHPIVYCFLLIIFSVPFLCICARAYFSLLTARSVFIEKVLNVCI